MINENELNISNKSYTNKDFESIYSELLELAKKISYKFDPTSSNESDPFIMLLKLMAFVGDKNSYTVDKNILERFMPSATQETSMADLTSRLGYNMHYYVSAETTVSLKYNPENSDFEDEIYIPKYSVIKNNTNTIQYVTKNPVTLTKNKKYID